MGKNFCFVFFILLVFDSANLEFSSTWLRLRHLTLLKAQSRVSHRTFIYCICNIQLKRLNIVFDVQSTSFTKTLSLLHFPAQVQMVVVERTDASDQVLHIHWFSSNSTYFLCYDFLLLV